MADKTHIEWADATWNPVTGCSVVSPGCTNCYAMRLAGTRLKHEPSRKGLTRDTKAGPVWTGDVRFNEQWLDQPLRWKWPRRIFVCAHGDLFAERVPDEWIDRVFAIMALAPQHTFLVLTKRAARMREYWLARRHTDVHPLEERWLAIERAMNDIAPPHWCDRELPEAFWEGPMMLPNVWLGVSVEDQTRADERIPDLLATPAAKRFISAEPLLGPIDLDSLTLPASWPRCECRDHAPTLSAFNGSIYCEGCCEGPEATTLRGLDWVIAGGESGPGARPMHPDWARSLRDQCAAAGVPFFFKQWGEWAPHKVLPGGDLGGDVRAGRVTVVHPTARQDIEILEESGWTRQTEKGSRYMARIGKRAAGRLLDGREHSEFPT